MKLSDYIHPDFKCMCDGKEVHIYNEIVSLEQTLADVRHELDEVREAGINAGFAHTKCEGELADVQGELDKFKGYTATLEAEVEAANGKCDQLKKLLEEAESE